MGSEVLGTERGTRLDTGPLSTTSSSNSSNSSSGKGKVRGGQGPKRGRAAPASISGSAWLLGGVSLAVSAKGRGYVGLGPTRVSSAELGLSGVETTRLLPLLRDQ